MYKLIALDMDGTLLNEDKTISLENFTAIQNAKAKGVKVVLATGRPVMGIQRYLNYLNLMEEGDYAISFNGALVQSTKSGEILGEILMKHSDLKYLGDLSKELGLNIHALTQTSCITPKLNKYSELEATMNHIPLEIIDFEDISKDTIIVKIMFIDEPEVLEAAISKIPKEVYEKFSVLRSAPYFLEFLNKRVNKGSGIELLAEKLGIMPKEIICVGDAGNDIHMIKYAGLGVAMDNAVPEVKEIADFITKSNCNNGVAHVINKFILETEETA